MEYMLNNDCKHRLMWMFNRITLGALCTNPSVLMSYLDLRDTFRSHSLCIDLFGCISTNQIAVVRGSIAKNAGSITCCY